MNDRVEISGASMSSAFDSWEELWSSEFENPVQSGDGMLEREKVLTHLLRMVGISPQAAQILDERIKAVIPALDLEKDPRARTRAYQRAGLTGAVTALLAMYSQRQQELEAGMN